MSSSGQAAGAASGAAAGAQIGSVAGPVGTVVGGVIGGVVGWFAGGDDASDKAVQAAEQQLAFDKERYAKAESILGIANARSRGTFQYGMGILSGDMQYGEASYGTSYHAQASLSQAYMAESYDMKAYMAEAALTQTAGFVAAFKEASDSVNLSLETFNRRYGNIMDNMEKTIEDVTPDRLAAQGREQLMLDADTLKANFRNELARTGLTRSGITVEAMDRMAMDTARQARAIDVNANQQSIGLQSQGIQALNSMTNLREGIAFRNESIAQNKASGLLQSAMNDANNKTRVSMQNANLLTQASAQNANNKTRVSMQNAQNKTNVGMNNANNLTKVSMQNASNDTNVSMNNAQIASNMSMFNAGISNAQQYAISNQYLNQAQMAQNAYLGFYSGVAAPNNTNVVNAYTNQQTQNNNNWQAAGKAVGSMDWKGVGEGINDWYDNTTYGYPVSNF